MQTDHTERLAQESHLPLARVSAAAALLEGGATVPFIARYRKEATGSLDEVAIAAVRDGLARLKELDSRRDSIIGSLAERNLLTDDLRDRVFGAKTLADLEDVYLPFRPKRRTRAQIAREKGLEPLAAKLREERPSDDPEKLAAAFVSAEKEVKSAEDALSGARDIIAEQASEDLDARAELRDLCASRATIRSRRVATGKEVDPHPTGLRPAGTPEEGAKFKDYFDWQEPAAQAPSHRVLAMRRGEAEGFLFVRISPPEDEAIARLEKRFVKARGASSEQVRAAVHDSWKRLLGPQLETELRLQTKERADLEAIKVFAKNVREVLLAAPLGEKRVLALDPGFRTGCKTVVLDAQGKLLFHGVLQPHTSEREREAATRAVVQICQRFSIEAVAIGNGTAGRETESWLRAIELPPSGSGRPPVVMVNESGASIYSASDVAREEFPDQDVTVRGAVSIGRRLMDPLAELVKVDPKSIGVGQYQHDVDESALKASLDDVVVSCVNKVGVEVNTASKQLLAYVSGLGPSVAAKVVAHREANGAFRSRKALREVAGLGPKTFEQAAGFLRVRGGEHPLDSSAVHPERYAIVDAMAKDLGCTVADLVRDEARRKQIKLDRYVAADVGLPTLHDILEELRKPGRDPRERFEPVRFAEGVNAIGDLKPGMKFEGVVTNVTAFGAFVDVGVHQDGLVHVSQIADRRVSEPGEIVKVGDRVKVTVIDIDLDRKRIGLSMRSNPEIGARRANSGGPGGGQHQQQSSDNRGKPARAETKLGDLLKGWQGNKGK